VDFILKVLCEVEVYILHVKAPGFRKGMSQAQSSLQNACSKVNQKILPSGLRCPDRGYQVAELAGKRRSKQSFEDCALSGQYVPFRGKAHLSLR
jgi:hypothetical protein